MNRILISLLGGIMFLTACGQASSPTQPVPIPVVEQATITPSPITTAMQTSLPLDTPTASTPALAPGASVTPLPTIPTFTPTFDASTIITVTAAPKGECPATIPYPNTDFDLIELMKKGNYANAKEAILWFLHKYDPQPLVEYAWKSWGVPREHAAFQDLTNDGLPELAIGVPSIGITAFYIFGCKDGHYEELLYIQSNGLSGPATFFSINDNNRNGLLELTLLTGYLSQGGPYYEIYEWDGKKFSSLVMPVNPKYPESGALWVEATGKIHYEDIDRDLVQELILDTGVPVWETYYAGLPWRNERVYYKWNGKNYVPYRREFAAPVFRYQAVQDGDLAVSQNEFSKALKLYQEAIFDGKLNSYSPEIRENLRANWELQVGESTPPTLTPYPSDFTEYPRLAAYTYYRIMLLSAVQGKEIDVSTTYNTLQQKFSNDPYGRPYVEMATAFWNAYQSAYKMYDGCAAAIQYATEHPEILISLGSDYHGSQSHIYVPADVCPFR